MYQYSLSHLSDGRQYERKTCRWMSVRNKIHFTKEHLLIHCILWFSARIWNVLTHLLLPLLLVVLFFLFFLLFFLFFLFHFFLFFAFLFFFWNLRLRSFDPFRRWTNGILLILGLLTFLLPLGFYVIHGNRLSCYSQFYKFVLPSAEARCLPAESHVAMVLLMWLPDIAAGNWKWRSLPELDAGCGVMSQEEDHNPCVVIHENFEAKCLPYVPPVLTFNNSAFCPHSVFMCFVWISEQTAIISLYSINWLVFITETLSVYCAVRTGCLYTM